MKRYLGSTVYVKKLLANVNPICPDFQHVSSSTLFLMRNWLPDFLTVTRNSLLKFINACTSFRKHFIVLFDWQPSRHSDHPREFLNTFSGTVATDGYPVYHKLAREHRDLKVAGCWVHARRPFAEFIKSVGQDTARGSIAQEAYHMITEIMHINNTFEYFNLLLTEIPHHMDDKDLRFIDDLLPWSPRIQKECPSRYKKT